MAHATKVSEAFDTVGKDQGRFRCVTIDSKGNKAVVKNSTVINSRSAQSERNSQKFMDDTACPFDPLVSKPLNDWIKYCPASAYEEKKLLRTELSIAKNKYGPSRNTRSQATWKNREKSYTSGRLHK